MQTMNRLFDTTLPRAMHFALLASLIYFIPIVYALGLNRPLVDEYAMFAALFYMAHFILYVVWYGHKDACLTSSKVQLLFYMGIAFCAVMGFGLAQGLFHAEIVNINRLFFGYAAMPTLYSGLAIANYGLFVWSLRIY